MPDTKIIEIGKDLFGITRLDAKLKIHMFNEKRRKLAKWKKSHVERLVSVCVIDDCKYFCSVTWKSNGACRFQQLIDHTCLNLPGNTSVRRADGTTLERRCDATNYCKKELGSVIKYLVSNKPDTDLSTLRQTLRPYCFGELSNSVISLARNYVLEVLDGTEYTHTKFLPCYISMLNNDGNAAGMFTKTKEQCLQTCKEYAASEHRYLRKSNKTAETLTEFTAKCLQSAEEILKNQQQIVDKNTKKNNGDSDGTDGEEDEHDNSPSVIADEEEQEDDDDECHVVLRPVDERNIWDDEDLSELAADVSSLDEVDDTLTAGNNEIILRTGSEVTMIAPLRECTSDRFTFLPPSSSVARQSSPSPPSIPPTSSSVSSGVSSGGPVTSSTLCKNLIFF